MKKILIIMVLFVTCNLQAQQQEVKEKPLKSCKTTMTVKGNCEMCKARIEKAALKTKGVKYAVWDVNSKLLKLIYNQKKTSKAKIAKAITDIGHDVDSLTAKKEVYEKLHVCCQYTR